MAQGQRGHAHPLPIFVRRRGDAAEQHVRVPGDILGQRLDGYVHPVPEGLEVVDAPGVVHQHLGSMRVRHGGQGGDVLHLEGVAARGFREHDLGVRLHEWLQARSIQRGLVVGGADAHAMQQPVAEGAGRAVAAIGHKDVVAGAQVGQQRGGDGGQAGGDDLAAGAALNLCHHVFQRMMRRVA